MAYVIRPDTAVRHRYVFELRYEGGELFWDRCGRIARTLASREGWATRSVDTNGCHIQKEDQNLLFSFSSTTLSLNQAQNQDVQELLPVGDFAAIAEEFSEIVCRSLEVTVFPRIGFRVWTLYPDDSIEDASSRVSRMSFFAPCNALSKLGELSYLSHSVVINRAKHMVRVAATPFEQQVILAPSVVAAARVKARDHWKDQKKVLLHKLKAEKAIKSYPPVGVMVDLDAYLEDVPSNKQIPVLMFITNAMEDFGAIGETILSGGN